MPSHKRYPFKNTWHPKPPHSNKEKNTKIQQQVFTKAPNEPSSFQQAQHQPLTRKTNKKFPITEFQPPTSPQQPNSNSARLTAGSPSHKIRCLSLLIFLGRGTEREPKKGGTKLSCVNVVVNKYRIMGVEPRSRERPLQQCIIK